MSSKVNIDIKVRKEIITPSLTNSVNILVNDVSNTYHQDPTTGQEASKGCTPVHPLLIIKFTLPNSSPQHIHSLILLQTHLVTRYPWLSRPLASKISKAATNSCSSSCLDGLTFNVFVTITHTKVLLMPLSPPCPLPSLPRPVRASASASASANANKEAAIRKDFKLFNRFSFSKLGCA